MRQSALIKSTILIVILLMTCTSCTQIEHLAETPIETSTEPIITEEVDEVYDGLVAYCKTIWAEVYALQISECQYTTLYRSWLVTFVDKRNSQIDCLLIEWQNGQYVYRNVRYGAR